MRNIRNAGFLLLLLAMFLACRHGGAPPISDIPTFYVLTTASPFSTPADRRVILDRSEVSGLNAYRTQTFDMKTPGSDDKTTVVVTTQRQHILITAKTKVGNLSRSLSLRYPVSLAVKNGHLWLSTDYLHLDAGRACFAPMAAPAPTEGHIWVGEVRVEAVNRRGAGIVVDQTSKTFRYQQRRGTIELVAGDRKNYSSTWLFQPDGRAEYSSRLFDTSGVLLEQSETITPQAPGLAARAMARYYETDQM